MNCSKIMDMVYEYSGNDHGCEDSMPLFSQIQIWVHTFFCSSCAQQIERYELTRYVINDGFFPPPLRLEDRIMEIIAAEEESADTPYAVPAGILSTRGWVIAGLIILVSLVTVFFGIDFKKIASESGMSFLLPVGITIGIVLTTYGVIFIGSHLKELTERFGL